MDRRTAYAQLPLHREVAHAAPHKKLAVLDIETRKPEGKDNVNKLDQHCRQSAKSDDTETGNSPLYGPICAYGICLYGNSLSPDEPAPTLYNSLDAVLALIVESYAGFTIASHNGAGYEFNYLVDPLRRLVARSTDDCSYCAQTIHQGEKIIGYDLTETTSHVLTRGKRRGTVVTKKRHWRFLDTYPLFHMSLAEVAEAFCPELPKLEKDHSRHEWSADNPLDVEYLVRDCQIVYVAYRAAEASVFAQFGARLGRTAGATALHAFTASIPTGHVYYRSRPQIETFIRRAYRGGLVLPGLTTEPIRDVALLDMSGAYGYQMRTHTFPVGAPVHTFSYQTGYTGVYSCHVTAPRHLWFGVIAEEHGEGYPLGSFNTVTTSIEIEYARTLGYEFEVYEGYYWTREEPVFQPFMEKCQALELQPGMKPLAKMLRNSLYGKFCTREQAEEYHLLAEGEDIPNGSFVLLDPQSGDEIPGLYSLPVTIDANYIMPIWGVLITAYQRVYVAERANALYAEGAPTVYVDTDSLCTTRSAIAHLMESQPDLLADAPVYGGWKVEQEAALLLVTAPKVYALLDSSGKILRTRAKGLPLKQLSERDLISSDTFSQQNRRQYSYVSSHNIAQRLKHPELPIRLMKKRALSLISSSPGWSYNARSGSIRPIVVYREPLDMERTPIAHNVSRDAHTELAI